MVIMFNAMFYTIVVLSFYFANVIVYKNTCRPCVVSEKYL